MTPTADAAPTQGESSRGVAWFAGLVVAIGAAAATAHGLFEVAAASGVPAWVAWLYPIITDGLALVAYAATARLTDSGRGYAWTVVVLAAGLSGLAQATYLAGTVHVAGAPVRFGVGAWPAIAAAIAAHLLFLLGSRTPAVAVQDVETPPDVSGIPSDLGRTDDAFEPVRADPNPVFEPESYDTYPRTPDTEPADIPKPSDIEPEHRTDSTADRGEQPGATGQSAGAGDRARAAAREHHHRYGRLPTVSELMNLADVGRGTAGAALKQLRDERPNLHVVAPTTNASSQS